LRQSSPFMYPLGGRRNPEQECPLWPVRRVLNLSSKNRRVDCIPFPKPKTTVYMTVAGTRRFQGMRPQSLYIKAYILRIRLRDQFMYLAVSMRLTILTVCVGCAELNALPSDCRRISSLRFTPYCCPTGETLILGGGFRNRRQLRSWRPAAWPRWNYGKLSYSYLFLPYRKHYALQTQR
jgi:hypothetical protein